MARITKASIDEVVAAADMLEVVGLYTPLRKAGANYTGLCPFHQEKTPSFSVDPVEKLYYCFGCGEGGDLLSFVQKKENLDFAAAVEQLADRYGVALTFEDADRRLEADRRRSERLRALLEQACAYYERVLAEARAAEAARAYLRTRGLGDDVCRLFRLGFSVAAWSKLRDAAVAKGFTEQELLDAGLVVPGKRGRAYDRFRGRLMFPLADERGRVVGFGARTLGDDKPKYLNSPETPLYHKSEALFGLDKAKAGAVRDDRVYIVEGYTDVLALVQAGVTNVVASMGTALTEQQVRRLARHTRNLYLCFDADAAGIGAMSRALALAKKHNVTMHVVRVPAGLDPADYVLSGKTGDDFTALAARAQTLLQFQVRSVLSAHDLAKPDQRTRAVTLLTQVLAEAASPLERDEEVRFVADTLQLSQESTRYLLKGGAALAGGAGPAGTGRAAATAARTSATPAGGPPARTGSRELEVRFLAGCMAHPPAGRAALAGLDEGYFASQATRDAFKVVAARLNTANAGENQQAVEVPQWGDDDIRAEIVLRAAQDRFAEHALEELSLRLQEAHLNRLLAKLKAAARSDDTGERETQLVELEALRRQVREAIRNTPVEE
jgi:DNA primase